MPKNHTQKPILCPPKKIAHQKSIKFLFIDNLMTDFVRIWWYWWTYIINFSYLLSGFLPCVCNFKRISVASSFENFENFVLNKGTANMQLRLFHKKRWKNCPSELHTFQHENRFGTFSVTNETKLNWQWQ